MIYISERLFRTAHADVLLLEHHQNVCVSTMCREKHVLKIVSCKKKRRRKKKKRLEYCKGFLTFPEVMTLC